MNTRTTRPSAFRTLCRASARLLTVAMLSQSLVGCGGPASVERASSDTVEQPNLESNSPQRLRVSTTTDAGEVLADFEVSDQRIFGTRTITSPDGEVQVENIDLAFDGASLGIQNSLPDFDIEVLDGEQTDSGAIYSLQAPDGQIYQLELEGESDYLVAEAAIITAIFGGVAGLALITACGAIITSSIYFCANRDRCWDYSLGLSVCSGRCTSCP